ncbi:metallophosphoesterase [bacterium]|nr:MAG: metallophosphoesterase [bacterium]
MIALSRRQFLVRSAGVGAATMLTSRLSLAQQDEQMLRVALICDTHTNRETKNDMPLFAPRFDAVIEDVNTQKVDLILLGGDLTESGKPDTIVDFKAQSERLVGRKLFVPGNHDIGAKLVEGQKSGLSAERVARFEKDFGPSFWVDQSSGARIVGINASILGSGLEREAQQWEFLEKALEKPVEAPFGTHLLTHYPPYLKSPDEASDPYWNIEPAPRARLLALLKRARVRGVFSGHLHYPLFNENDQMQFITAPPVSFGLPRDKQPQGWTLISIARGGAVTYQNRFIAI